VLHHTQSSRSESKYWYNGVESGELAQNALIAGYYNVPLVMVSGDVATCREATQFFGDKVVTVATKRGLSREAAELYPFEETQQALYEGAKRCISVISEIKPYKVDFPCKVKKQYQVKEKDSGEPKIITKEKVITNALEILDI
jgi:D-amino peptidase